MELIQLFQLKYYVRLGVIPDDVKKGEQTAVIFIEATDMNTAKNLFKDAFKGYRVATIHRLKKNPLDGLTIYRQSAIDNNK